METYDTYSFSFLQIERMKALDCFKSYVSQLYSTTFEYKCRESIWVWFEPLHLSVSRRIAGAHRTTRPWALLSLIQNGLFRCMCTLCTEKLSNVTDIWKHSHWFFLYKVWECATNATILWWWYTKERSWRAGGWWVWWKVGGGGHTAHATKVGSMNGNWQLNCRRTAGSMTRQTTLRKQTEDRRRWLVGARQKDRYIG